MTTPFDTFIAADEFPTAVDPGRAFNDDGGYFGFSPLPPQRFHSYPGFPAGDVPLADDDDGALRRHASVGTGDGGLPPSLDAFPDFFSAPESNGVGYGAAAEEEKVLDGFFVSDGPILPPPSEMQRDDGFALQEWRRENAIMIEEKQRKEKEIRDQILVEAEEYKHAFHEKRKVALETNKIHNREREKLFLANQDKFSADADKNYWKAITEMIPRELLTTGKTRRKKDQEKPSVVVIQGPKPGKATDLSRMRQILSKLKNAPPPHIKLSPSSAPAVSDGAAAGTSHILEDANNGTAAAIHISSLI